MHYASLFLRNFLLSDAKMLEITNLGIYFIFLIIGKTKNHELAFKPAWYHYYAAYINKVAI